MAENEKVTGALLEMTTDIVASHVANNQVSVVELKSLIVSVFETLSGVANGHAPVVKNQQTPAVSIKDSVTPSYIICLEDGKKLKMLKRHLMASFGLTPDEYRTKWGLPADYPMVAPKYADHRRQLAKTIGLGRKKA